MLERKVARDPQGGTQGSGSGVSSSPRSLSEDRDGVREGLAWIAHHKGTKNTKKTRSIESSLCSLCLCGEHLGVGLLLLPLDRNRHYHRRRVIRPFHELDLLDLV